LKRSWFQVQPPPFQFDVERVHRLDLLKNPRKHWCDLDRNAAIGRKGKRFKFNLEYYCSIHSARWDEVDYRQ